VRTRNCITHQISKRPLYKGVKVEDYLSRVLLQIAENSVVPSVPQKIIFLTIL